MCKRGTLGLLKLASFCCIGWVLSDAESNGKRHSAAVRYYFGEQVGESQGIKVLHKLAIESRSSASRRKYGRKEAKKKHFLHTAVQFSFWTSSPPFSLFFSITKYAHYQGNIHCKRVFLIQSRMIKCFKAFQVMII